MSMYENKLLSKVIDEGNFYGLNKYNITANHFLSQRDTYYFIRSYVQQYKETPSLDTVVTECKDFMYEPSDNDNFKYLCSAVKSTSAKVKSYELLQKEAGSQFSKLSGAKFVNWLKTEVDKISESITLASSAGTNYATNGAERLSWYEDSKLNRSDIFIPTPFPGLTKWSAGGFELGDYILLMAYTNRGKSWIGSLIGLTAWLASFGVLYYSPELSKRQQMQRFDTLNGHFNNVSTRNGELKDEDRNKNYLDGFNNSNETPFIVKTMEDLNNGLSVDVIESDLQENTNIKMVIIDGFNLMTHKGREGNRNNMSNTSRKLRQIFGRYSVAGLVIHQTPTSAEKENRGEDETGSRIVEPPRIDQYSETVAVIQDPATVLTFDQHDGVGALKIAKARQPNVGKIVNLHCDFNMGYVNEATEKFDF